MSSPEQWQSRWEGEWEQPSWQENGQKYLPTYSLCPAAPATINWPPCGCPVLPTSALLSTNWLPDTSLYRPHADWPQVLVWSSATYLLTDKMTVATLDSSPERAAGAKWAYSCNDILLLRRCVAVRTWVEGGKPVGSELLVAAHRIPPTRQDHEHESYAISPKPDDFGTLFDHFGNLSRPFRVPQWSGLVESIWHHQRPSSNGHLSFIWMWMGWICLRPLKP